MQDTGVEQRPVAEHRTCLDNGPVAQPPDLTRRDCDHRVVEHAASCSHRWGSNTFVMLSTWKRAVDQSRRDLRRSSGADLQRWRRGFSELVEVERTAQHFRGSRPWWRCPECGRRCRNLHAVDERSRCRTCLGLTYVSSQSTRWIRRVRKVRHLGERASRTESGTIVRPRYMHQVTWHRHLDAYRTAAVIAKVDTEASVAPLERDRPQRPKPIP